MSDTEATLRQEQARQRASVRYRRRKLRRLQLKVDQAVRTASQGGWTGGLEPGEQAWVVAQLWNAWDFLDGPFTGTM